MKFRLPHAIAAAALFALAACSGGEDKSTSLLSEAALAAQAAFKARGAQPAPLRPDGIPQGLTRAAIAGETRPMVLVNIATLSSAGTLLKTGENRGYVTWVSNDRLTLTTKSGVLTGSRGLRHDLMAGDAEPVLAAIRAGGAGAYSKVLRHIGDDRQIAEMRLTCQMQPAGAETVTVLERSHPTRHFVETCSGADGMSHRNDYWVGSDGTMWRSRQFLHPASGAAEIRRLIR